MMKIYEATQLTDNIVNAFNELLPQLNPNIKLPDRTTLEEIIGSADTKIFIASEEEKEGEKIVGALTLVFQNTPSGSKAWIEDVVVSKESRGKGIGKLLMNHAIDYAEKIGTPHIDLTSRPDRIQANKLYQKLGFEKRETNVYRLKL